jgi:hypothetical protein
MHGGYLNYRHPNTSSLSLQPSPGYDLTFIRRASIVGLHVSRFTSSLPSAPLTEVSLEDLGDERRVRESHRLERLGVLLSASTHK